MIKPTTDQMGRSVQVPERPTRIISLVPSQTELLYDLGLREEVVGITKFCVHPNQWFRSKNRIGGTKQYKLDLIDELQPDLIIGNKEENDKTQIEALAQKYPVWMSDILTLEDALDMISQVGALVNKISEAESLRQQITQQFKRLNSSNTKVIQPLKAAYFIWKNPNMIAANHTFIHSMLELAGFKNAFEDLKRYPVIMDENLKAADPNVILLSSEPYPFQEKHFQAFHDIFDRNEKRPIIKIVDGELFSWYGSRLLKSVAYFEQLQKELQD